MPPTPDADVDAALDKLIDEYGGRDWFLMRTGATEEQIPLVRRDIDVDLRVKRMLDGLADDGPGPTDEELHDHYEANIGAFMTDEQVRASHILKNPSGEGRRAAYDALRAVRSQLKAGADFEATGPAALRAGRGVDRPRAVQAGRAGPGVRGRRVLARRRGGQPGVLDAVRAARDHGDRAAAGRAQAVRDGAGGGPPALAAGKRDRRTRELVDRLKPAAAIEEVDADAEAAAAMA